MQTTHTKFNIKSIQASWQAFDAKVHLRQIQSEADYARMAALMNGVLDAVGDDEDHPLTGLLDLLADLVSRYEQQHHRIEAAEPGETLRFLMESRGLKQADLSAIIAQGNLSATLAGKRKISATLAGRLGKFFGVSSAAFVPS